MIYRIAATNKWDLRFLEMSELVGNWSKDPSTKCGAVITSFNNEVISVGYNGFPSGMDDSPELYNNREEKLSRMIHAEMNALLYADKGLISSDKDLLVYSTLYTTPILPCERCVVHMLQAGIRRFVSRLSNNPANSRWEESLTKTRKYIKEYDGEIIEL